MTIRVDGKLISYVVSTKNHIVFVFRKVLDKTFWVGPFLVYKKKVKEPIHNLLTNERKTSLVKIK